MLRWRLFSAAIIVSVSLAFVCLDFVLGSDQSLGRPGICLIALALAITAMAADEVHSLLKAQNLAPRRIETILGTMLVVGLACVPMFWRDYPVDCPLGRTGWIVLGVAAAIGILFISEMFRYRAPGTAILRVATGSFVVVYIGVLFSFLVLLRTFDDNGWGMTALLSVIIIVKLSDTGAYAAGKLFGRHKLAPVLSPGKTIEGMFGAFLAGGLAAWLVFMFLPGWLIDAPVATPWWRAVIYGLVVTVAGMLGDLAESLLKRDMQTKDSSSWIPGLGGVLDIADSMLVAAPAAFLCWILGLVGPA